jgi:hypothetical protein
MHPPTLAVWHIEAVIFDLKALDSALGLLRQLFITAASGAKKHLWKSQCQEDATVGSLVCVTVNITY